MLPESVTGLSKAEHRAQHEALHVRYNLGELLLVSVPDTATVRTGTTRITAPVAMTILGVSVSAGVAPTGASLIIDVNKNGTTVYTTQGNRPAIAASAFAATETVPDVTALAVGDYLTFDIDQVGSAVAGADLVIVVRVQ